QRRDRRAPCAGRHPRRDLRAVPGRGRLDRHAWRHLRLAADAGRLVAGAAATGGLRPPRAPGHRHVPRHVRTGGRHQPARRADTCAARQPRGSRLATQGAVRRTTMQIKPILAVLRNACFLMAQRWKMIHLNSGVDESSLAVLVVNGFEPNQAADVNARMLAGLQAISGVQSATMINQVPFGTQAGAAGVSHDPGSFKNMIGVVDFVLGSPGTFKALGLKLVAGRLPQPDDYQPTVTFVPNDARVLVTRALAEHAWPGENPLGKDFWCDNLHFRVIGVMDRLARAQPHQYAMSQAEWTVFTPTVPGGLFSGTYLLRARPQDVQRVLRDARAAVAKIAPDVVLDQEDSQTLSDLRASYFKTDRIMIGMLLGVVAL